MRGALEPVAGKDERVVIIGLGGAGCKAASLVLEAGSPHGVMVIAADTDSCALRLARAERKIELRGARVMGLGSGGHAHWARACAEIYAGELQAALAGAARVVLVAGLGGGTGSGAGPVVLRLARAAGASTAAVVTQPLGFEGERRRRLARAGLETLAQAAGTLLVLPLDELVKETGGSITLAEFFIRADWALRGAALALAAPQSGTPYSLGFREVAGA